MRRRMIGLITSVALALFGTTVLVSYVQSAHDKAGAAEPTTTVLVATGTIAKGTKATDLGKLVAVKDVPVKTKVPGSVSSVDELAGKVAVTELVAGEQVLAARFKPAIALGRVEVPKGLLEVTVSVDPMRAVGGALAPGDQVAVLASFDPMTADEAGLPPGSPATPDSTHVIVRKALVTHIQVDATKAASSAKSQDTKKDGQQAGGPDPAPGGAFLVTLAVDPGSVERVVFTAEFGKLWLAHESADAPDGGTSVRTRGSIYG